MNILTLDHVTKSYTGRKLFEDASFYLQEGEKVGVIGVNGTGKSTFLRILAGTSQPDEGKVIYAAHTTVQMLPQTPVFEKDATVLSAVLSSHGYAKEHLQGHEAAMEAEAKAMLTRLGVTDFSRPAAELSGGQKKRLALVSVLLHKSDILILDEPTNHLDAAMSEWLEETLRAYKGTIVMVTHDRYFLDSVATRIVEIDRGSIYSYDTNYAGFLERKAQREEIAVAADRKRKSILRTELAWIQRGARARSTKQKARIERFEQMKDTASFLPEEEITLSSVTSRMGKTTVELHDIGKAYGEHVLIHDFTYCFLHGDRVGFIGKNGCGKTTLMKMIATAAGESAGAGLKGGEQVLPDSGQIVIGQTIKVGYYSQELQTDQEAGIAYMDPEKRVIDYVRDTAEFVQTTEGSVSAAKMCERFLFDSELQYSRIGKLSGGQKRRLNLLRVLMEAPNVLILDEPTNDLDIRTLTILEDYLDSFDGIVITVSHDRYFLDRCVRRIFAFEGDGEIRQYEGGYTDYLVKSRMAENSPVKADRQPGKESVTGSRPGRESTEENLPEAASEKEETRRHQRKLSYKEQKEYDTIEQDIAELEERIAHLDTEIGKAARDFVRLNELTQEKEKTQQELNDKMERWMYLEELMEQIRSEAKR